MQHIHPQSQENPPQPPSTTPESHPSSQAACGHLRNGQVYPDPFPFDPPSREESDALKLTPPQRIALEHILMGSQLSIAARAAGVTRPTLCRWLHRDPIK